MSQNDLSIANQGFPAFRSDLNAALQALGSTNSGTSAPSTTYANQLWYDTTNNILYIRNEDNDAWIKLFTLDQTNDNVESLHGDTIAEATSGSGVTIDSVLLKDGELGSTSSAVPIHSSSLNGGQFGGRRNLVVNGAMQVSARGVSTTGVGATDNVFPCVDRMRIRAGNTAGRATVSQVADVHDGFANALKFECTTADTSIAANEYFFLQYSIEGQDVQHLKKGSSDAEKFTVSFYVKGNANATYTCEIKDQDNTRYIAQQFSVTSSWSRVTLTFNNETSNALGDDNGESLRLSIWLHGGSDYTGGTFSSNTWHTTVNQRLSDSQTSFFDSTSRTFFITGLQMELGEVATNFEMLSFSEQHQLCKRYFQKSYDVGVAPGTATTVGTFNHNFLNLGNFGNVVQRFGVSMRASPVMTVYDGSSGTVNTIRYYDGSSDATRTTNFAISASTEQWNMADDTFNHTNIVFQWVANAEF